VVEGAAGAEEEEEEEEEGEKVGKEHGCPFSAEKQKEQGCSSSACASSRRFLALLISFLCVVVISPERPYSATRPVPLPGPSCFSPFCFFRRERASRTSSYGACIRPHSCSRQYSTIERYMISVLRPAFRARAWAAGQRRY
jgi:hypothetical protein